MRPFLILLLLASPAFAKGERELVTILEARARAGFDQHINPPDQPPNIQIQNLMKDLDASKEAQERLKVQQADLQKSVEETKAGHQELQSKLDDSTKEVLELMSAKAERDVKIAAMEEQIKQLAAPKIAPQPDPASVKGQTPTPSVISSQPTPSTYAEPEIPEAMLGAPEGSLFLTTAVGSGPLAPYEVTAYEQLDAQGREICEPCRLDKKQNGKDGDESVHLTWTGEQPPAGVTQRYPIYVWHDAHGRIRFLNGRHKLREILYKIETNDPPQGHYHVAAAGRGGGFRGKQIVATILAKWDEFPGDGQSCSMEMDKSGDQSLSVTQLLHGQPWPLVAVLGRFGRVGFSTTNHKYPLYEAGVVYRAKDNNKWTLDPDPFDIYIPDPGAAKGVPIQAPAEAPAAYGMDPITLGLTLFSIGRAIYQMLNPEVDLGLPGTLKLEAKKVGQKLTIQFKTPPQIHIDAWFRWDLKVQRVEITPDNIRVVFVPQPRNWLQVDYRDIAVF